MSLLLLMLVLPTFLPSLVHSVYHVPNVSKSLSGMEALACNRLEELPAGVTVVGR